MIDQSVDSEALKRARAVGPLLAEQAAETDRLGRFPSTAVRSLRESGLMGLLVPTAYGGLGGSLVDLVQVAQELAGRCLATAMVWAMHCQQVETLALHAKPSLAERLLPRIASGTTYLASVTTERGTGGHLLTAEAPLTGAEPLAIRREAPVVTGGAHADGFLVTMRASEDASPSAVSLVYAERDQLRVEVRGCWDALGMRGTESVPLYLEGVVPADQVVGEAGSFRELAIETFIPAGHLAWAACWLGAARAAYAGVVSLLRRPGRQGLNVGSELLTARLARARLDLEVTSAYLKSTLNEVLGLRAEGVSLGGVATQVHLNCLKIVASERCFAAVDRLVQLVGLSGGYLRASEVPLERHLRDLRSASLNYSNDRLLTATGSLVLLDREVSLA